MSLVDEFLPTILELFSSFYKTSETTEAVLLEYQKNIPNDVQLVISMSKILTVLIKLLYLIKLILITNN